MQGLLKGREKLARTANTYKRENKFNYPKSVCENAMEKGSCTFVGWINNFDRIAVQNSILRFIEENELPLQIIYGTKVDKVVKVEE